MANANQKRRVINLKLTYTEAVQLLQTLNSLDNEDNEAVSSLLQEAARKLREAL